MREPHSDNYRACGIFLFRSGVLLVPKMLLTSHTHTCIMHLHCGDGGGYFFLFLLYFGWYAMKNNSMHTHTRVQTHAHIHACTHTHYCLINCRFCIALLIINTKALSLACQMSTNQISWPFFCCSSPAL